jgi:hypothetical protein
MSKRLIFIAILEKKLEKYPSWLRNDLREECIEEFDKLLKKSEIQTKL